ncbi:MAG: hypothetical protein C0403_08375 [Desulfobacterium sp.]|nr:hypothetical protein [Desulfobacterium sp.]
MKPPKLHIKIFYVSLLILILTEVLVFFLFSSLAVKYVHTTALDYLAYRVKGFRQLFEGKLQEKASDSFIKNQDITSFLKDLEQLYKAKVCLLLPNGNKTICSSDSPILVIPKKDLAQHKTYYYKDLAENDRHLFYMHIPITFPGDKEGAVIAIFDLNDVKIVSAAEELVILLFFLYIAGIGLGTAILLFPASRFISRPIRTLRDSAIQIADGDLSHRVTTKSNDEIGDLGNAFNLMADAVERMVKGTKQISANISHELRSPLARIRIALEILRDKLSEANQNVSISHIDIIENEIEDMDSLISRILLLSKLDFQKLYQKKELVDIAQIILDLIERFASAMQTKSINLKTTIPKSCPSIFANHNDIHMAMSNLIDNAVKYTPDSGKLEIKITREKNHIEIFIANTCVVESQINLDKFFEPFYRPAGSKISGYGLGLTIAKTIVENYRGKITASPWNNNGIGFSIKFNI